MSHPSVEALIHACSLSAEMSLPGHQSIDECKDTFDMECELRKALEIDNVKKLEDIKSRRGETALQVIVKKFDGGKILHVAVRLGAIKCLQVLLNCDVVKADIEAPDDKGRTALMVAVVSAQSEALEKLLMVGANVNARDDDHFGVLHLLLIELSKKSKEEERKHLMKVADLLLPINDEPLRPFPLDTLDLEPHANLACREDATPLSAASAILQQQNSAPWAPIIVKLCEKLMKVGAKYLEVKDELESNAVDFAYNKRRPPQRKLELRVIDAFCRGSSKVNLEEELSQCQSKDAIIMAVNSQVGRHSLLFWAVDKENENTVEILLKYGANPRMEGNLPIERSAEKGLSFIFKLLLEDIKPTITQDDIDRLTDILKDRETDGHMECLKLIQDLQL